jgi:hypothetical protein
MAGGGGIEHASGGEFGGRVEQPGDDQRENEIAATLRPAAWQQTIEADAAGGGQRGENMAMRQGATDFETALAGGDELIAAQGGAQRLDLLIRPGREIGQVRDLTLPPSR